MPKRVRIVGAMLLLASLALPIRIEPTNPLVPAPDAYVYVLGLHDEESWLYLFILVWPTLALVVLHLKPRGPVATSIEIAEPPLLVFSYWYVTFTILDALGTGARLAAGAFVLYATGTVWSHLATLRDWYIRRRA
jgi:hypothetical protein